MQRRGETKMSLKNEFRNRLIKPTVRNALRLRFYQRFWGKKAIKVKTTDDLPLLPIIDKALYQEQYENDLPDDETPSIVSHSTGTTGRMTFRFRSNDEITFNREFFSSVLRKTEFSPELIPLTLTIAGNYHGGKFPLPGNSYSLEAGVGEESELKQVLQLLQLKFNIPKVAPKISQIQTSLYAIKLMTFALLENDIAPHSLNIRFIILTGEYVSPQWKKFIEDTWQAKVVNRYSLSEIFGGATLCSLCDSYHFDSHVVAEVVDLSTFLPIMEGIGVLVLTELYPFIQYQPLIRYFTQDLVQIVQSPCEPKNISVRLLGRTTSSVIASGRDSAVLIPSGVLHDILDEIPEIGKEKIFTHIPGLSDYEFGKPKTDCRVIKRDSGEIEVMILVGSRLNVHYYTDRVFQVEKLIRDQLLARIPQLKTKIENGFCKITVKMVNSSKVNAFVVEQ